MLPLLLNEKETSILLCVSVSKLQKSRTKSSNLIAIGKLPPFVKLDGLVRYVRTEVEDFVVKLVRHGFEDNRQYVNKISKPEKNILEGSQIQDDEIIDIIPGTLIKLCSFMN